LNYDERDAGERGKSRKNGKGATRGDVMISNLQKGNL
jgi:hypothetical protein